LISILWFALDWLARFLLEFGGTGLIDGPLFAISRQMMVTGDWITPFSMERLVSDKPPLIYWLMAIAYSALG